VSESGLIRFGEIPPLPVLSDNLTILQIQMSEQQSIVPHVGRVVMMSLLLKDAAVVRSAFHQSVCGLDQKCRSRGQGDRFRSQLKRLEAR
jgi:hypothetical protein